MQWYIGKGKLLCRIADIHVRAGVPRGLRKAMVEGALAAAANTDEQAVEDLSSRLVCVEALNHHVPQEAAAL